MTRAGPIPPVRKPAPGHAGLVVRMVAGQSAATDVWCSSPLKLLTPRSRGPSVWAYLSSFGGGMVAGDQIKISVRVESGARCFLTTQSSTKVYRNPARQPCSHELSARVDDGALLVLVPDAVQAFADSNYRQTQQIRLHPGAGLVLVDWFTCGRAAREERWNFRSLQSRNDVFIGDRRCLFDSMLLDSAQGPLTGTHRLARYNCVGLVSIFGDSLRQEAQSLLEQVRHQPVTGRADLVFSASAIRGGTVLRIAGLRHEDVAHYVYQSLGFVGRLLHDDPWKRKLHAIAGAN